MPYCRCSYCNRRKTIERKLDSYVKQPQCKTCGRRKWRVDTYRGKKERAPNAPKPCTCGHYPFPHRKESGMCFYNPELTHEMFEDAVRAMAARRRRRS